jgi:hypothetical protein
VSSSSGHPAVLDGVRRSGVDLHAGVDARGRDVPVGLERVHAEPRQAAREVIGLPAEDLALAGEEIPVGGQEVLRGEVGAEVGVGDAVGAPGAPGRGRQRVVRGGARDIRQRPAVGSVDAAEGRGDEHGAPHVADSGASNDAWGGARSALPRAADPDAASALDPHGAEELDELRAQLARLEDRLKR